MGPLNNRTIVQHRTAHEIGTYMHYLRTEKKIRTLDMWNYPFDFLTFHIPIQYTKWIFERKIVFPSENFVNLTPAVRKQIFRMPGGAEMNFRCNISVRLRCAEMDSRCNISVQQFDNFFPSVH